MCELSLVSRSGWIDVTRTKFLYGKEILNEVMSLIRKPGSMKIAVSYWGVDSVSSLVLIKNAPKNRLRVLCDLEHPACRIEPIKQLVDADRRVRDVPKLHAKVWIKENEAVIGSANASKSALGFTIDAPLNSEAAIYTNDTNVAKRVSDWFDDLWEKKGNTELTKKDMAEAAEKESRTRPARIKRRSLELENRSKDKKPGRYFSEIVGEAAAHEYISSIEELLSIEFDADRGLRFDIKDLDGKMDQFLKVNDGLLDSIEHRSGRRRVGKGKNSFNKRLQNKLIKSEPEIGHLHRALFRYVENKSNFMWFRGEKGYGMVVEMEGKLYRFSLLTYRSSGRIQTAQRRPA